MTTQLHNQNKPSAVATLLRESVDKPSAVGSFIMQEEIWKDVKDYEGLYQVSNMGNIRRLDSFIDSKRWGVLTKRFWKGGKINPNNYSNGYQFYGFCKNGVKKQIMIHRIVASLFIPNPENKRCVNHRNGIKTDNRVDNLEWATHSENNIHSYNELGNTNKNQKPVIQKTADGVFICEHPSIVDAAKTIENGKYVTICAAARKRIRTAYGFIWDYKNKQ